ncbi:sodium- and chloride-dependent glycine transporter 1-like isoform X2 [Pomacea canaliculata]|uniref:sodium- and chloride-dependent glycine transporter 1-like isoform X2 n=1 Tax=Pomacea canaliculata TaxID=400727 RepID=UPI000D725987|nr:sodium- and chloride-dependent glycine transporter 1-like isoform X2 [Pomacea canaliculata]
MRVRQAGVYVYIECQTAQQTTCEPSKFSIKMNKNGLEIVAVEEITDPSPAYEKCPWISEGSLRENSDDGEEGSDENANETSIPERANWGGRFEFLLTCIGYAVGLGNVWRFPYLCYKNGGGAFLIPYLLMLALVGLPLFFMELAFGQFASLGPITIWRVNPLLKGLGYGMVIVSWLISLYYNVVISYVIFYLYASLTSVLPWTSCGNSWNTVHCISKHFSNSTENATQTVNASSDILLYKANATVSAVAEEASTAAEEYYRRYVLEQSDGIGNFGTINWKLALCLLICWVVVGGSLIKGVQSLGKVVYFTATFPYLMLTVLLIRGLTLNGAGIGIEYYLKPDFEKLKEPRVWSDAATQIFYSLSACSGGLIAMSSFNKFTNNCYRDALIVALLNSATSIYAGFVIFSILGFMAYEKGVPVSEVAKQGPGLAFEVYPEALSQMPVPPLWSVFFFLMMATLGFGSQFSIVECVISALIDEFRQKIGSKRNILYFRIFIVITSFILGLPMVCKGGIYLLNLIDFSVGGLPLLLIGFIELVALNWIYGFEDFWCDIVMMIGEKPKLYWKVCWTVVSPVVIFATILFNIIYYKEPGSKDNPYPGWALALGWLIALFPIAVVPAWFIYKYCTEGGWQLLKLRSAPLPTWGPALATNRTERYEACESQPPATGPRFDLLTVTRPEEFLRLMAGSTSTLNTGSSLTINTNVGSIFGSKSSV